MAQAAWKWMVVAAAVGAGVLACDGDDDGGGDNPPPPPTGFDAGVDVFRPGLGEDEGAPQGTPFSLPEGVSFAGTLRGAAEVTGECENASVESQGSGATVRVCVPLRNDTGAPVEVVFPPGLVVVSTSEGRGQNGLLIERTVLTVPPTPPGPGGRDDAGTSDGGVEENAYIVPLYMYCLNEERDPSNPFITYAVGPVTSDDALQELLGLLQGKRIDSADDVGVVQYAIYSITEGRGLTTPDRDAIDDL
ncbi:hypothetical protein HV824_30005 [Myxococcus sp. AM009]|uniref:hypothetical protein n=1 Tax=unclassified Myxococcus TaxID=2648731 RepID=UPI001595BD58|nr:MULTISPECIES: hypothetical protein [unclassified Myxococcus]NVJ02329.1 hypothetical protein [Myxococcus sp. AM009]NVJ18778.1 hypothetical protein [Myxococcus sp. AM010]